MLKKNLIYFFLLTIFLSLTDTPPHFQAANKIVQPPKIKTEMNNSTSNNTNAAQLYSGQNRLNPTNQTTQMQATKTSPTSANTNNMLMSGQHPHPQQISPSSNKQNVYDSVVSQFSIKAKQSNPVNSSNCSSNQPVNTATSVPSSRLSASIASTTTSSNNSATSVNTNYMMSNSQSVLHQQQQLQQQHANHTLYPHSVTAHHNGSALADLNMIQQLAKFHPQFNNSS